MKTEVSCGRCNRRVQIEDAYNRHPKGFLCCNCYGEQQRNHWIVFGVVVAIMAFVAAISAADRNRENQPQSEVGIQGTINRAGEPPLHYSISLGTAEKSSASAEQFEIGWQEQIPDELIGKIRFIGRRADNLAFDSDEVLTLPGNVVENSNKSIEVRLRALDGAKEYQLIGQSDDFAECFSEK